MKFRSFAFLISVPFVVCAFLFLLASAAPLSCSAPASKPVDQSLIDPPALDLRNIDKHKTRILIEKANYQLHLYQGDSLLRTYPCVFGPEPKGDKFQQGDGRTPEGFFKVKSMYAHDKWSKFVWIDYPNEESWKRFNHRKAEKMIPASASIGGDIGIHGVPSGYDHIIGKRQNWTLGCISLDTDDIYELYAAIEVGTVIEIVP